MVYLTLTVQCQTGVRKVTLRARGHGALCKKGKGEKKALKHSEIPCIFSLEKNFLKIFLKNYDAALKTLLTLVISHITNAFVIGLRISGLDSGTKVLIDLTQAAVDLK